MGTTPINEQAKKPLRIFRAVDFMSTELLRLSTATSNTATTIPATNSDYKNLKKRQSDKNQVVAF